MPVAVPTSVSFSSLVSRASVTCLLGFEQSVYVFFVGVKGVDDVLAGRSGALRSRQGRR